MEELRTLMKTAAAEYPHLEEHSRFLEGWAAATYKSVLASDVFPVNGEGVCQHED